MHYDVFLSGEGKNALGEFPDCPGCQTFAKSAAGLAEASYEALNGWLEAHLIDGQVPPRPAMARTNAPAGKSLSRVPVRPALAAALAIRWARQDAELSQKELGHLAGISQQQIAKLENPDENPTIESLEKVAKALGLTVSVGFESRVDFEPPTFAIPRSRGSRANAAAGR